MSEFPSWDFNLQPIGDDDSFYRTSNAPGQIQRESIIKSGESGSLAVQVNPVEVIHGTLKDDLASLIVTDFKFVSLKASQRFKSAVISYRFASIDPNSPDPEVLDIAPKGSMSMKQSEHPIENLSRPVEVSLGGRISASGVKAGLGATFSGSTETSMAGSSSANVGASATLGYSWDEVVEIGTSQARVAGITRLEQRQYGEDNTAVWSLTDRGEKNGIPTFMRTAILLKRKNHDRFQATIEVKATADLAYTLRRMLGGTPEDHPVTFDPKINRTGSGDFKGDIPDPTQSSFKSLYRIGTPTSLQEDEIGEGLKGKVDCPQECSTPADKMSKVNTSRGRVRDHILRIIRRLCQ
jgi:hypothetical protein